MKVGISTASLLRISETENALNFIKQTGAETAEVYLKTFYEYRPEFAKKFAGGAEGLEITSVRINPQNFESQLFSPSRRERGDGFYWLDQVMRSAQLLGAKNYTFHGLLLGSDGCKDFNSVSGYLNGISDFCAGYGVALSIKNNSGWLYDRPDVFGELKSRCNNLTGAFDLFEAHKSNFPFTMYLRDMSGAISHVYVADRDKNGNACLPGQGISDFKEILTRLKNAGFDGNVIINTMNFEDLGELKSSVEFLKKVIYNIK